MSNLPSIHQWIAAAHRGDAIGDNARVLRDMFRSWGHESEIFALTIDENMAGEARLWSDPASRSGDITIYHYAVPSPMTEAFGRLPGARVLHYHNVTPGYFFAPYDAGLVRFCDAGREQLATMADRTDLALGVSEFNRAELEALGFPDTGVLPIAVDVDRLRHAPPVPSIESILAKDFVNILYVCRIAPNKKIEDIIRKASGHAIRALGLTNAGQFYVPSFSHRTIVYKGMLLAHQVGEFFTDLRDARMVSAIALAHQRFSTNTFPTWDLAHPFRFIAHNGEINTLRGNVNWIRSRHAPIHCNLLAQARANARLLSLPQTYRDANHKISGPIPIGA